MKLTWKDIAAMLVVGIATTYPMWVSLIKKSEPQVIGVESDGMVQSIPLSFPGTFIVTIPMFPEMVSKEAPPWPSADQIVCWMDKDYYIHCKDWKGKSRVRR